MLLWAAAGATVQAQVLYSGPPPQAQPDKLILFRAADRDERAVLQTALFVVFFSQGQPWALGVDYQLTNTTREEIFLRTDAPLKDVQVSIDVQQEGEQEWQPVPLTASGRLIMNDPVDPDQPPLDIQGGRAYVGTTDDLLEFFAVPSADNYRVRLALPYTVDFQGYDTLETEFVFTMEELELAIQRAAREKQEEAARQEQENR